MCRYAVHIYKVRYACFHCRKMFRKPPWFEMAVPIAKDAVRIAPCPQCGAPMENMGKDFKPPRQTDVKQWQKVQRLLVHGYRFHSCGCCGPGPRPANLRDVDPFLREQEALKADRVRQQRIEARAMELSQTRNKKAKRLRERRIAKVIAAMAADDVSSEP